MLLDRCLNYKSVSIIFSHGWLLKLNFYFLALMDSRQFLHVLPIDILGNKLTPLDKFWTLGVQFHADFSDRDCVEDIFDVQIRCHHLSKSSGKKSTRLLQLPSICYNGFWSPYLISKFHIELKSCFLTYKTVPSWKSARRLSSLGSVLFCSHCKCSNPTNKYCRNTKITLIQFNPLQGISYGIPYLKSGRSAESVCSVRSRIKTCLTPFNDDLYFFPYFNSFDCSLITLNVDRAHYRLD